MMRQKGYVTQNGCGHVYPRRGYAPLCYQGAGYINPQSTLALRLGLPSRELFIREVSESPFSALPRELIYEIFQQYALVERARYLQEIGAPRGEYTVADYIQENGMPPIAFETISLNKKGFTSLAGVEKLDGTIYYLSFTNNYITDYYDPYLDPYVYYVVNNRLKRGAIEPFRGFDNLRSLGLNYNQLIELPVGIFKGLENLIEFRLNNNQLRELPVGIFNGLGNLMSLYLDDNQLRELTVGIFNGLGNLEFLQLNDNQLGELPVGIFKGLENLTQLFLNRNQLRELPVKIFTGLGKLELLTLQYNYLPDTLDEFKNAHELSKNVKMLFYPQNEIGTLRHQGKGMFYPLRCLPIHRYPCWC